MGCGALQESVWKRGRGNMMKDVDSSFECRRNLSRETRLGDVEECSLRSCLGCFAS